MATEWVCPLCEVAIPAGEIHVCPVADRPDPGAHLGPDQKYQLLREMVGEVPETRPGDDK